jgi:DNA-dependent protein kinase catalytic subunit
VGECVVCSQTVPSYLTLRNGFARSLACVSIAGYVAGIGDRHLDNLLVNLSTGLIVAIDFGHAFGSATFQLGIPELVPFRLTPQLVNFLDPIGPHGLLVHNMTHVMSCFVEHRLRLLNLMEIFLKEPHMDWIKHSEKNPAAIASVAVASSVGGHASSDSAASAGGSSVGTGVVAAFAERRLKLVRDKLQMRNPAYITCDELNENTLRQSKPQVIEKLKEQAMGYKVKIVSCFSLLLMFCQEFNFRARIGEKCGSVAQQVEALVDQATDPNILSRFWLGWLSYC